jgi:hypothetical protein
MRAWILIVFAVFLRGCLGHGVNFQPSYYNGGNVTFGWDLMHKYAQIESVRIEIEPGVDIAQAREWIKQAHEGGYSVVATYHHYGVIGKDECALGNNNVTCLLAAASWWVSNYEYLREAGEFQVNLCNEWGSHHLSAENYASAYNQAIETVRTVYAGSIIIDIPGYGQETTAAVDASPMLTDNNLILSAHVYPLAFNEASRRWLSPTDMEELSTTGRPCMIGEFGLRPYEGESNVTAVVNRAKELGFPVFAWSFNGDGNDLNMASPSWSSCMELPDEQDRVECYTSGAYEESAYFGEMLELLL